MEAHEQSQQVLSRLIKQFSDIEWAWVISVDTTVIASVGGDQEKHINLISHAIDSLSTRLEKEFVMGRVRYSAIVGTELTLIIFPIDMGSQFILSIALNEQPSVDEVANYIINSKEMQELEAIWLK